MSARLARLRQVMAERQLDAMFITQPENRRYLSGFTGSAGYLLISAREALLATDFRYYEQVQRQSPEFALVRITDRFEDVLPQMVERVGAQRIGFESASVTFDQYQSWTGLTGECEWVATKEIVEELRTIKDAAEIAAIRRAVAIADEAIMHLAEVIRPGMTEREAAWELEAYMRTHGADETSFRIIVAAGPNGAMPHAVTSDRPIQAGEPIVMDLGAKVDGYCSDLTRTFCIGEPKDDLYLRVWHTVLQAQQAAEAGIRAGMSGVAADALARQVIADAGYGDNFGHGLGHGVGLAIHEKPRASRLSEAVLPAGSVLTIEPGIYLPGWGGVRIEDMAVITPDGVDVLTAAPKVPTVRGQ